MTAIPVTSPYVLKTASCIITRGANAPDDFTKHVDEITLTPAASSGTWVGISGNVIQDQGIATWAATLGLIQDLASTGLLRYLLEHEGEKATIEAALASGSDTLSIEVTLTPATIGGAAGDVNPKASKVTLPMDGKPAFV